MGAYLLVLLVAAVVSYVVTPAVLVFSRKIGAVDIPDDRKVHAVPTPTLGGTAIFLGFIAAFAVASSLTPFRGSFHPFLIWPLSEPVAIGVGAAIIFALGVIDDVRGMTAPVKLSGQILAAGFVFLSGVRLEYFRFPLIGTDALSLSPDVSAIATILWIVVMVNAVNLIDGLDGLAAGIVAIAAGTFFVYSYQYQLSVFGGAEQTAPLVSIVIFGATLGFLRHNFNPAKIFMGDSGSMTLGFLLAVATVVGVGRSLTQNPTSGTFLFYLPLAIPVIVLALPILDTLLAVIRRARRGGQIFHADKEHLHHRLLEIGHGHRQAVLIMYAWAAVVAGGVLAQTFLSNLIYKLAFVVAAIAILLYTMLPRIAQSLIRR
jgi:UDP-GlcNAc:undecaprenyl-phosphate GlcNAc-1-phosphate transferase